MLQDLQAVIQAWGLVGRMFAWLGSHNIIGGVSFLDLIIFGVCFDTLIWAIGRLLPGLLGSEKSDDIAPIEKINSDWSRF